MKWISTPSSRTWCWIKPQLSYSNRWKQVRSVPELRWRSEVGSRTQVKMWGRFQNSGEDVRSVPEFRWRCEVGSRTLQFIFCITVLWCKLKIGNFALYSYTRGSQHYISLVYSLPEKHKHKYNTTVTVW